MYDDEIKLAIEFSKNLTKWQTLLKVLFNYNKNFMIAKQEIFNKFKSSLETGEQSETLDFDGYTTTSQYYAYLKFLKFYKLNRQLSGTWSTS